MGAMRFRGAILPDGEVRDLYVVDGHVTYEKQLAADTEAQGWIVPGLVDAHCHIGLNPEGAASFEETEAMAIEDRDGGTLLIRDCGSPVDTSWIHGRDDLPRLIRAGRHIARTKRYLPNYAHEIEPAELPAYVAEEAQRGDGWVKLVGDWIARDEGDLRPSFAAEDFAKAIGIAHEHGAKVTAHCFGRDVLPGLIGAGIDCIEHGTGLTTDLIDQMVDKGIALVPTVMQTEKFPEYAEAAAGRFPAYTQTMTELYASRREVILAAHEAGLAMFAGSDNGGEKRHGNIAGEVLAMHEMGLPADYALGAASWRGREWLGWNARLDEGAPADFVVFPRNPLEDLSVLREPSRIVLRGKLVG